MSSLWFLRGHFCITVKWGWNMLRPVIDLYMFHPRLRPWSQCFSELLWLFWLTLWYCGIRVHTRGSHHIIWTLILQWQSVRQNNQRLPRQCDHGLTCCAEIAPWKALESDLGGQLLLPWLYIQSAKLTLWVRGFGKGSGLSDHIWRARSQRVNEWRLLERQDLSDISSAFASKNKRLLLNCLYRLFKNFYLFFGKAIEMPDIHFLS